MMEASHQPRERVNRVNGAVASEALGLTRLDERLILDGSFSGMPRTERWRQTEIRWMAHHGACPRVSVIPLAGCASLAYCRSLVLDQTANRD